jgi:predicted membrane protein
MNHLSPYDYIIGFASVTALVSIIEMIDTLRFLILLLTFVATLIKAIEQWYKSREAITAFTQNIIEKWKKLTNNQKEKQND